MTKPIKLSAQRGTAIIVALFVTALVAAAAIAMIEHLRIDTRRTELSLNNLQANLYAQGSIAWAKEELINNWKQKQTGKVIDRTPIRASADHLNGATITSIIYDAQGKLNVNNLNDPGTQMVFFQLLRVLGMPENTADTITKATIDWITPGINNSKFDKYYAKLNPPYRSAHNAMASVSELRLVQGMTADIYAKLLPYVTALPDKTKLNINSVPIPVIMAFQPSITQDMAKALDMFRQQTPFATLDKLPEFPAIQNTPFAQTSLTTSSDYFLLRTDIALGTQHLTLYTLLLRLLKNEQPVIMVLWQSKGTL